ncbi:unnamed protein product [Gulo gulo]|uniref:Uncharacterized protein n=1 Tax=Gulo gulo TaxID=48420 RepID=A0A9X9PTH6_GULGU|nr:unnamed protein product [Gulo gulo]
MSYGDLALWCLHENVVVVPRPTPPLLASQQSQPAED